MPVHALVEVFILQLALLLGTSAPNAMRTFDPLLLKGMAARRPLVRLLSALQQQPAVQLDAKTGLQVHKRHDAEDGGAERDAGEGGMTRQDVVEDTKGTHTFFLSALFYWNHTPCSTKGFLLSGASCF